MKKWFKNNIANWHDNNTGNKLKNFFGKHFRLIQQGAIALLCVAAIVSIMPRNIDFKYDFKKGYPWEHERLESSFDFSIIKDSTQRNFERDSIEDHFIHCYRIDYSAADTVFRSVYAKFGINPKNTFVLDSTKVSTLIQEQRFAEFINRIYKNRIILPQDFIRTKSDSIRLIKEKKDTLISISKAYTTVQVCRLIAKELLIPEKELSKFIIPNIIYDHDYSKSLLNKAIENIPTTNGIVRRGQKIISKGEIVDSKTYQILTSYKKEIDTRKEKKIMSNGYMWCGQALFVAICFIALMAYFYIYANEVSSNNNCFILAMLLVTIFPVLVSAMMRLQAGYVAILPYAISPMLLSAFTTKRTAFLSHTISILICSITLNQPYVFILLQIPAGLVAMLCMKDLASRSRMFICALLVLLTYSVIYLSYHFIMIQNFSGIDYHMYIFFLINAILLTLTYPLMFLVEKIFGFVSNVTLIELSNINNSLLLKLSQLAPGTFQHSMQVGNLASEAALSIGANSLEVRVGALYHDIGKMKDPIYFTENQSGGINPHDSIPPEASTLIIKKHVSDGLELGKNLPQNIKNFITTHHGTSKTGYFYITYKNAHPDEEVDDKFFSYPGPKPFTREQGILMMADSIEAAARSIKEYTAENIDQKVEQVINGKLNDGDLSDTPLTLKEINTIKEVFKQRLKNIYHTRISYPTENKKDNK